MRTALTELWNRFVSRSISTCLPSSSWPPRRRWVALCSLVKQGRHAQCPGGTPYKGFGTRPIKCAVNLAGAQRDRGVQGLGGLGVGGMGQAADGAATSRVEPRSCGLARLVAGPVHPAPTVVNDSANATAAPAERQGGRSSTPLVFGVHPLARTAVVLDSASSTVSQSAGCMHSGAQRTVRRSRGGCPNQSGGPICSGTPRSRSPATSPVHTSGDTARGAVDGWSGTLGL